MPSVSASKGCCAVTAQRHSERPALVPFTPHQLKEERLTAGLGIQLMEVTVAALIKENVIRLHLYCVSRILPSKKCMVTMSLLLFLKRYTFQRWFFIAALDSQCFQINILCTHYVFMKCFFKFRYFIFF